MVSFHQKYSLIPIGLVISKRYYEIRLYQSHWFIKNVIFQNIMIQDMGTVPTRVSEIVQPIIDFDLKWLLFKKVVKRNAIQ